MAALHSDTSLRSFLQVEQHHVTHDQQDVILCYLQRNRLLKYTTVLCLSGCVTTWASRLARAVQQRLGQARLHDDNTMHMSTSATQDNYCREKYAIIWHRPLCTQFCSPCRGLIATSIEGPETIIILWSWCKTICHSLSYNTPACSFSSLASDAIVVRRSCNHMGVLSSSLHGAWFGYPSISSKARAWAVFSNTSESSGSEFHRCAEDIYKSMCL